MPEVCWQRLIFAKKELHPVAGEPEFSLEGPGGLTSLYQSPLAHTMPVFQPVTSTSQMPKRLWLAIK